MNKAIIVLTGTPRKKNRFLSELKKNSWVWSPSPFSHLKSMLGNNAYWTADDGEDVIHDIMDILNLKLDFHKRFIDTHVQKLKNDESISKNFEGKKFTGFVLVFQGIPKFLWAYVKETYGAYVIQCSDGSESIVNGADLYIDEKHGMFEENVEKFISIISEKGNNVQ